MTIIRDAHGHLWFPVGAPTIVPGTVLTAKLASGEWRIVNGDPR